MTTAPTPAPAPDRPRSGRGLRLALGFSLALNLAVLGLGVGMALHGALHGGPDRRDMVRELSFGPFTDALRPEDRKALRDRFLATTPDFAAERARMKADGQAILAALRADPFDAAALDTALATMQAHVAARMDKGTGILAGFLTAMTPQDRLAFADRLEAVLRHGGRIGDGPAPGAQPAPGN
jgi:uncharacterized membrane protein